MSSGLRVSPSVPFPAPACPGHTLNGLAEDPTVSGPTLFLPASHTQIGLPPLRLCPGVARDGSNTSCPFSLPIKQPLPVAFTR